MQWQQQQQQQKQQQQQWQKQQQQQQQQQKQWQKQPQQQQQQWQEMHNHPEKIYQQPPSPYDYQQQQQPVQQQKGFDIQSCSQDNKTIWVGGLLHWMDETYLQSCFAQTAEVSSIKLMLDKQTGQSGRYGFGFIEFVSHEAAEKVLQTYNWTMMPNTDQAFWLNWASFSTGEKRADSGSDLSIFVGDLAPDVTDTFLYETFADRYPSVKAAQVAVDANTGCSKGYGFVRFGDENERTRAVNEMNGQYCSSRPMRIGVATDKQPHTHQQYGQGQQQYLSQSVLLTGWSGSFGGMPQNSQSDGDSSNTTIFVEGLDSEVTDEDLRQTFSQCGEILSVKILVGKGCGFVQFASRSSAEDAIQNMHGTVIGKQTVRLSWGKTPANRQDLFLPTKAASPSASTSTSTSTSSLEKSFKYHVYVSFSEDIRKTTFLEQLFEALLVEGICTYKDDEKLKKGEPIDDELLKVIEESKFFIIVFSKNYISSCSNELAKITECHNTTSQTAFPVFYDMDLYNFNKDALHVFYKKECKEPINSWNEAYKYYAGYGYEAKVIENVVKKILLELSFTNLWADVNLVGMEARVKDVASSLETGFDDLIIGIKGIGGIGKTTLAKTVFSKIHNQFEGCSFVEDVREVSRAPGLASLQKKVLSDVLHDKDITISSVLKGKSMIKEKLHRKKVLLVLDDVDHIDQLEALAGAPDWFKPGSKIIVTTRDTQVLLAHGVKCIHTVECLLNEEAIYLFCRHAFGRDIPIQGYEELSLQAVRYAAGIPLTIKVLGSFLCGKKKFQWTDALERLKAIPLAEFREILKLSYKDLEVDTKEIFLDVACLLKGLSIDDVSRIPRPRFQARDALRILEKKSLIKIKDYRYVVMHHLIEEAGKDIDRVHLKDPNKHSRLWTRDEIEYVLAENLGTKATKAIAVDSPVKLCSEVVTKGFGSMKKLRLLRVVSEIDDDCDEKIGQTSQNFPDALRFLSWEGYPHWSLPITFLGNNLVVLEMPYSKIVQLWEGGERKILYKLKFLNLRHSRLRTLDLGLTPNLERLDLEDCYHLVELHMPCVGYLESLVYANLSGCSRVKKKPIPEKETLEELELRYISLPVDIYKEIFLHVACLLKGFQKEDVIRILGACYFHVKRALSVLEKAYLISIDDHQYVGMHPQIEAMGKNIVRRDHPDKPNQHSRLWIREEIEYVLANDLGTEATKAIVVDGVKLSSEIVTKGFESMKGLGLLHVVSEIDDEKIGQISLNFPNELRFLSWEGYPHWYLPKTFDADNLVALEMPYSSIIQLWEGGEGKTLYRLKFLNLRHTQLRTLDLSLTPNLERLELEGCNHLVELLHMPITCLRFLVYLNLSGCLGIKSFVFIKELGSLQILSLSRLYLKEFPDIIPGHCDSRLQELKFRHNDIEEVTSSIANLQKLVCLDFHSCRKLRSLPDSICGLQHLRNLKLYGCNLKELPQDIGRLGCLEKLNLSYTSIKHLPDSFCALRNLKTLKLSFCRNLEKLPADLGELGCLEKLVLTECTQLKDIPDSICRLRHLKYLDLLDCCKLEKLPMEVGNLVSLEVLNVKGTRIRRLPPSISKLIHLEIHATKKDRSCFN